MLLLLLHRLRMIRLLTSDICGLVDAVWEILDLRTLGIIVAQHFPFLHESKLFRWAQVVFEALFQKKVSIIRYTTVMDADDLRVYHVLRMSLAGRRALDV